ncbi:methyltransferase domain-containing protein [bacterium]|nr:MAG: methyltransferase domain-containing protein [bacterium]
MKLNLGACDRAIPGYLSVDIAPPADVVADLSKPWPWENDSVEAVKAYQVFEHIADSIHVMNELWRVCRKGALVEIEVPSASHGAGAFQDPTHKSFWTKNTFQYFEDGAAERERFGERYGIMARFKVRNVREREGRGALREGVVILCAELEAVK